MTRGTKRGRALALGTAAALVALGVALVLARRAEPPDALESPAPRGVGPDAGAAFGATELTELATSATPRDERRDAVSARSELRGFVRWRDGASATGAHVVAFPRRADGFRYAATVPVATRTGADGGFVLAKLTRVRYDVEARAIASDGASWSARKDFVAAGDELVLELGPGHVLRGYVVDELGDPVPVFRVEATARGPLEGSARIARELEEPSGMFELAGLHAGRWSFVAEAAGYGRGAPIERNVPGAGGVVTLVIPCPAAITGQVVDVNGDGIEGALVEAFDAGAPLRRPGPAASTTSAANGSFAVRWVPEGPHRVRATAHGHVPSDDVLVECVRGRSLADLVLVLGDTGAIEGRALRRDGEPARGQVVRVVGSVGGAPPIAAVTVSPDGSFGVEALAPDRYALLLDPRAPDVEALGPDADPHDARGLVERAEVAVRAGETARVEIGRGGRVRLAGRVVADAQPLRDGAVFMRRADWTFDTVAELDESGEYVVELDGPGDFVLEVVGAEGDATIVERALRVPAVALHRYDVVVETGAVAGSVHDPSGRPLADVPIFVRASVPASGGADGVWTGPDGRWTTSRLAAGPYEVCAGGGDDASRSELPLVRRTAVVRPGETTRGIDFVIGESIRLRGRVVDATGAPCGGAWVYVRSAAGAEDAAEADAGGRFAIDGLAAGTYELRATWRDCAARRGRSVGLDHGEAAEVELIVERGGWLVARAFDATRVPLAALIALVDPQGQTSRRALPSSFERFGPLAPGAYVVRATDAAGAIVERDVTVDAGAETVVEVTFE